MEEGISPEVVDGLQRLGHDVTGGVKGFDRTLFGRGHIILRIPGHEAELEGGNSGSAASGDGGALEAVSPNAVVGASAVVGAGAVVGTSAVVDVITDGSSGDCGSEGRDRFYLVGCESRSDGAPLGY